MVNVGRVECVRLVGAEWVRCNKRSISTLINGKPVLKCQHSFSEQMIHFRCFPVAFAVYFVLPRSSK